MDEKLNLLFCLMGPCPECGNGLLQAVSDGDLTNFVCPGCGCCWHAELSSVRRVDPATCLGCESRPICSVPRRPYGQLIGHPA
jgi:hypothetical protein